MKSVILSMSLFLLLSGCIASKPVAQSEFDEYWTLTRNYAELASTKEISAGSKIIPAKWTIHQDPSLVRSTISLVRVSDKIKEGTSEVEFSVSPEHAAALCDIFAQLRDALGTLEELDDAARQADKSNWSGILAQTLIKIEHAIRRATLEEAHIKRQGAPEPLGLPAEPMLDMLAIYLNETAMGNLLRDMDPQQISRLRSIMTQMVLRLGFDLIQKELPEDVVKSVAAFLQSAENLDLAQKNLSELLNKSTIYAAPAQQQGDLGKAFRAVTRWSNKALLAMENIMRQWDRMESIQLELLYLDEQPLFVATVNVLPGKKLKMPDMVIFQPEMVFTGSSQVIILPEEPRTGETVITFEPSSNGGVDLCFEGVVYGLVRLFAIPIETARLREIRVFANKRKRGSQLINLGLFMESKKDKTDPRRMLIYQDVRKKKLLREAFSISSVDESKQRIFNYILPGLRYTYQSTTYPPLQN